MSYNSKARRSRRAAMGRRGGGRGIRSGGYKKANYSAQRHFKQKAHKSYNKGYNNGHNNFHFVGGSSQ